MEGLETANSGNKPSFRNGNVYGFLGDMVFARNFNVKDTLNLKHSIVGHLVETFGSNLNEPESARIGTFLRPQLLPTNIDVSKYDLDAEFELIIDNRIKHSTVEVRVEDIILVQKICLCSSPFHAKRSSERFPFFCRFALTNDSELDHVNVFYLVQNKISFTNCDCSELNQQLSEAMTMEKSKKFQLLPILAEKPQNTPITNYDYNKKETRDRRRSSRTERHEEQFRETRKENLDIPEPLKKDKCIDGSVCEADENLSPPSNKIKKIDSQELNSPCRRKFLEGAKDAASKKGYWASRLLDGSDMAVRDAARSLSPIKLSLRRLWLDDSPRKEKVTKEEKSGKSFKCEKADTSLRRSKRISGISQPKYEETDEEGSDHCAAERKNRHSPTKRAVDSPRCARKRPGAALYDNQVSPMKTPRASRLSRCANPSMPGRANALEVSDNSLEKARANLHVSAVPTALPCREVEFKNIYRFVEDKIIDAAGGCMYISGMPGTGKTATVHAVIRSLQERTRAGDIPEFQYVEVNGLRLTEPRQVFVQLLLQLTGQKCAPQQARDILSKRFNSNNKKNKTCVLLVDEVDMLRNSRQDVVYNLFEWPNLAYSRLIVLTIANTMDLPERLFMGRVTSRLGLTRLTFPAYTYKQLQEIVQSRLEGISSFNADAVQFVSRKVASISGDARRALDICRRATELVNEGDTITMETIKQALDQMLNSPNVKAIKACSKLERLFLKAVLVEKDRTGIEETSFVSVFRQFKSLCVLEYIVTPNASEGMAILSRLGSSRLLLTEHSRSDLHQTIYLNVSTDDVHYGLSDNAPQSPQ